MTEPPRKGEAVRRKEELVREIAKAESLLSRLEAEQTRIRKASELEYHPEGTGRPPNVIDFS